MTNRETDEDIYLISPGPAPLRFALRWNHDTGLPQLVVSVAGEWKLFTEPESDALLHLCKVWRGEMDRHEEAERTFQ